MILNRGDKIIIPVEEIIKALSHPVRYKILTWLKNPHRYFPNHIQATPDGAYPDQIVKRAGLAQSTISAHLAILERSGLVTCERQAQRRLFKRNEVMIRAFLREISNKL